MNYEFKKLVDTFFFEELNNYAEKSHISYRTAINHFLAKIGKREPAYITKQDILYYLNSEKFNHLKSTTQNLYKRHLKKFFKWYGIENSFLKKIKKKREKHETLNKGELIDYEDIQKMIKSTDNLQYKCLLIIMYETAGRIEEITFIKIGEISQFESYASIFLSKSKTTQRNIPVIQAIPYINQWLNNHPLRENSNAPLFIREYHGKLDQYSIPGIYTIIKKMGKCLDKKVYPHLFRHSRLTELAKFLTEAELCKFAGWVIGSREVRRYVHLAQEDVENKILSIHGIKIPEIKEPKKAIEIIKCPVCTYENSNLDKYCSRCGSVLDIKTIIKHREIAEDIRNIIDTSEIKQYIDKLFEEKVFKILNKSPE